MAKKGVSSIEKGAGYFLGFVTTLMNVARQKAVPFEAIYRLGTEGGYATVVKIVDVAHADWQAEQPKPVKQQPQGSHSYGDAPTNGSELPPDHYCVHVTYARLPSIKALRKKWGENNVSFIFDGRPFSLHASCVGMDRTPGKRMFYVHDAGGDWSSEEQIAWGLEQRNAAAPNGYRPATHKETYEFAKAHPELADFVGLGSVASIEYYPYVVLARRHDGQLYLGDDIFNAVWKRKTRVLFVSK